MQAFRRRRPANQNAVVANNTARQPAVIATTSVSTGSELLGEPETGRAARRHGRSFYLLTYLLTYCDVCSVPGINTPNLHVLVIQKQNAVCLFVVALVSRCTVCLFVAVLACPMSGSSFAPILLNSFKVIASLFLQYVVGALVAWAGVIKEADMRAFSAVMNAVLIPVLSVVSLGRGLSPAVFASDGWILALLGSLSMIAYAALAFALRPLAKPEPQFRRVYVLMMAIGNVVAIPLSVTQALCELGTFEAELPEDECLIRSRALVFTYVSFNSFFIWVVAYGYVVNGGPEATTAVETTPESAATAAKERLEESEGAEHGGVNQRTDARSVVLEEAATEAAQEAAAAPEPSRAAETAGHERETAAREKLEEPLP